MLYLSIFVVQIFGYLAPYNVLNKKIMSLSDLVYTEQYNFKTGKTNMKVGQVAKTRLQKAELVSLIFSCEPHQIQYNTMPSA